MSDEFNFDFDLDEVEAKSDESIFEESTKKEIENKDEVKVTIQKNIEPSAYFLKSLLSNDVVEFPWPHIRGESIIPKKLFEELKKEIPNIDKSLFQTDGVPDKRKYINLYNLKDKNELWNKVLGIFFNPNVPTIAVKHIFLDSDIENDKNLKVNLEKNQLNVMVNLVIDEEGYEEKPVIPDPNILVNMDIQITPSDNSMIMYYLETLSDETKNYVNVDELSFNENSFIAAPSSAITWFGTKPLSKERIIIRYSILRNTGLSDDQTFDFENDL